MHYHVTTHILKLGPYPNNTFTINHKQCEHRDILNRELYDRLCLIVAFTLSTPSSSSSRTSQRTLSYKDQ